MKGTIKQRKILALLLALVLVLTTIINNTVLAASSSKKVIKLTVKATSTLLNEGQILTKSMLKKSLNATARLKNGKTKKKYTSYNSKQIGKTIKPNSKGKFKVTITAGSAKKSVSLKVNRIKKIYFKNPKPKTLTEGNKFDSKAFKNDYTVYADYQKGADKKLTTYTVSALSVVKADANGKFDVTVKYGKKTAKISIPVTKPATEATTTESSTTEDTSQEKPTPGQPSVGGDTTEDPKPEQPTPEVPAVEEVDWLYYYDSQYSLYPNYLYLGIRTAVELPDDYDSIDEWGFIYTTDNVSNNNMVLDYIDVTRIIYAETDNSQRRSRTLDFSEDLWDTDPLTTVKIRIYAIVKKGEETETVYSEVLSVQLKSEQSITSN